MICWDWNPGVSVGALIFEAALVPEVLGAHVERLQPSCDEADWETYRIGDELARVAVGDGNVVSVECATSLTFRGNELLGLSVREVNRLLPKAVVLGEAYDDGDELWECDELGLMLWVENGIVASATVSSSE